MIKVRLNVVGGEFKELELPDGSQVADAIGDQGTAKTIKVNSQDATLETHLRNGDSIYVIPKITGN